MDVFSRAATSLEQLGVSAAEQSRTYEQLLGLRICVQKTLDEANKFPVAADETGGYSKDVSQEADYASVRTGLRASLIALCDYLDQQAEEAGAEDDEEYCAKRRKRSVGSEDSADKDTDVGWEAVLAPQLALQQQWEQAVNKQYSRLHYGNEKTHSKMKVFNQTVWEQVRGSMQVRVCASTCVRACVRACFSIPSPFLTLTPPSLPFSSPTGHGQGFREDFVAPEPKRACGPSRRLCPPLGRPSATCR
jgi:hypothetical protein